MSLYKFLKISLPNVDKTTAKGTEIKTPPSPKIETVAQIAKSNQNGWVPVFFPINFGVKKFESKNGTIKYKQQVKPY